MPRLYEYVGIYILFHSDEHKPVHVHAKYNDCEVKVSFCTKDRKIVRTTYTKVKGIGFTR